MLVKFARGEGLHFALRGRVEEYFQRTGLRSRDCTRMYVKSAILVGWFALSYCLLVFVAAAWWQYILLAISLGLAAAGIGFNLQHEGSHGAFSKRGFINRLAAGMLDWLGGSSYMWHWKHNVLHHTYTNFTGADDDLECQPLARFSPYQTRHALHRFQHLYIWFLYGLLPIKWQFYDDFATLVTGKLASHRVPRPRGRQLLLMVLGKALFCTWALAIPMVLHPVWGVLGLFFLSSLVLGITLSVVFQLAHCAEEADFPAPLEGSLRTEHEWAVHQVQSSIDFARHNWFLNWYLGGLNFQIEHHLFPHICHIHYPALAGIVGLPVRNMASATLPMKASSQPWQPTTAGCGAWEGQSMRSAR